MIQSRALALPARRSVYERGPRVATRRTTLYTPPPQLRYGTARHGRYARLFARIRVLRVGPDGFGGAGGGLFDRLGVVVGRGPSGHLPRRRPHVEHAALALQVAALELQHVQLEKTRQTAETRIGGVVPVSRSGRARWSPNRNSNSPTARWRIFSGCGGSAAASGCTLAPGCARTPAGNGGCCLHKSPVVD
jgi:hypothetical protein